MTRWAAIIKGWQQLNNDDHVYFIIGLLAMGAAVAHQVARVRALSRYYERG